MSDVPPTLLVERDGAVLRITFARPDKRNALDDDTMDALIDLLADASRDDGVRVVVLRGAGGHFCSGADVVARNRPADDAPRPRVGSIQRRLPLQANRLVKLVLEIQTPVVAVVEGYALGLGLHLALAADVTVAAADAHLAEPFVARGFTPDSGATWLLPRLVGLARARELLLLGRTLSGDDAAAWGVIHASAPAEQLDAAAEAVIGALAEGPTVALGLTKWLLNSGTGLTFDQQVANEALALELSSRSPDFREGMAAFREKRPPRFEGR